MTSSQGYSNEYIGFNDRLLMDQPNRTISNYFNQPSTRHSAGRMLSPNPSLDACSLDELYQLECVRRIEAEQLASRRRQLEYLQLYRRSTAPYQNTVSAPQYANLPDIQESSQSTLSRSCKPAHLDCSPLTFFTGQQNPILRKNGGATSDGYIDDNELSSSPTLDEPTPFRHVSITLPDISCMPPLTRIDDASSPTPAAESDISISTGKGKQAKKPGKIRCSICGEDAICRSYGAVCCDSCRLKCIVTGRHRSRCQLCRFQRCLANGMKSEFVLKNSKEKVVTSESLIIRANSFSSLSPESNTKYLTITNYNETLSEHEAFELHGVILQYDKMREDKAPAPLTPIAGVIELFGDILSTFLIKNLLVKFSKISTNHVKCIQSDSLTGALMLRMAYYYDPVIHGLPHCSLFTSKSDASLKARELIPSALHGDILNALKAIHLLKVDNTIICLLILIYISQCDSTFEYYMSGCDDVVEKFTSLLRKYIVSIHGHKKAADMFPKLLIKLCDVKELQMRADQYVMPAASKYQF
ncbi:Nuclear receptor subfamily 4 group A member 1 [Nymphon striatum]|nr:Nuclear receptor subfamily 4 group A member 1 [Nymphon striatum]